MYKLLYVYKIRYVEDGQPGWAVSPAPTFLDFLSCSAHP
jgi:hypothetical protein